MSFEHRAEVATKCALSAGALCAALLAGSCHEPAAAPALQAPAPSASSALAAAGAPAARATATPSAAPAGPVFGATFDDDLAFLAKHGALKVLSAPNGAKVAISSSYQGRVMTSALGPGGQSLGFINRQFIEAGKTATQFDNYGGEDRFWLGPEGGQYGL